MRTEAQVTPDIVKPCRYDGVMSERIVQLTKLRDADPNDPFLTYGLAMEHSKAGDYDDAIRWFDMTIELDAQYCYAYYQKAKALSMKGEDEAACEVIRQGIGVAKQAGDGHAASELAELLSSLE